MGAGCISNPLPEAPAVAPSPAAAAAAASPATWTGTAGTAGTATTAATTTHVWLVDFGGAFQYPESAEPDVSKKADIGIALSGGGLRAACLSLGFLRAFHPLGLLRRAKYISSISGGSWTHGPMTYSTGPLETFLGTVLSPSDCSKDNLEASVTAGGHAEVLAKCNFIPSVVEDFVKNEATKLLRPGQIDWWSHAVGSVFFEPHGIAVTRPTLPTVPGPQQGLSESEAAASGVAREHVYPCRPLADFPYPIVNGTVLVGGTRMGVPIEFTPLYYGIPPKVTTTGGVALGGALVGPPAACYAGPQSVAAGASGPVGLPSTPSAVISVVEQAGISSAFLAQQYGDSLSDKTFELASFPLKPYWSPTAGTSSTVKLADGRGTDNTGVLALLRRRCSFIVVCLANNMSVTSDMTDANTSALGTLAGLFGRQQSSTPVDTVCNDDYNTQRRVFPPEKWDELLAGLRALHAAGKAPVYRLEVDVLRNDLICVPGGHKAILVVCVNDDCAAFTEMLPDDTKKQLADDNHESKLLSEADEKAIAVGLARGNLNAFPNFPITRLGYTPVATALLIHFASWMILSSKDCFVI